MTSFTFATAGRIVFGAGTISQLPQLVAELGRRPFVCTGGRPQRHATAIDTLPDAAIFAIPSEPTMELVREAAEAARSHGAGVVVGLGGGAALDAAKVVAALVANGGDPLDYAEVVGRGLPLTRRSLPVIAVPTTSGTGSEVTANGVVTSTQHRVKVSLRSASMLPAVALIDPALTLACPPSVTAHAGLDALVQCIEPYVSPFATPLTDGFCREGVRRAGRSLRRAYADGSDLEARTDMSLCSLLSGLALANGKLGAAHGLAGPLGGFLGAPHGAITAAVMAPVSRANIDALAAEDPGHPALARYAEVGELLTGERSAEAYLAWFTETVSLLGIRGLASLGMDEADIPEIAEAASRASSTKGNPVRLPVATFEQIVRTAL
ncbi:MAG: iron-containing alcohol dehydrogenase [Propionibacteriaceae bacterium]|nr:iron-containing alcohol dehydrogenase [Propionibacteriaceae bacterium]